MWTKIKAFFKNSETIFLARLETFLGFVTAALAAAEWSHLFAASAVAGVSWQTLAIIGGIMFVKGIVTEWARRRREPSMETIKIP